MTILGLIVAGAIAYGFFGSAPNLSKTAFHNETAPIEQCLQCHMVNPGKNPVMPHRQMGNCTLCHRPE